MIKKNALLFSFIILKFALQYIVLSPEYELHRDEYLYLDQGRHLAWGYASVPPFTSWISGIIYFLGNSVFWVKFFPALFGVLTLFVVWKTIEELKGNTFALLLGATSIVFSALLRLNTLYQPNSLDILSWTTLYFVILKYMNTKKSKWLFMAALVFAFGFLNKYNIVFLLIGMIPALLIVEHRTLFIQKKLYVAALLAGLLMLPNLLWQYHNSFPVFHHLKELTETQLVNVDRTEFLRSQLLFFTGSLWVILGALYALLFYRPFQKYRAFFLAFFFTFIVFIYFRAKGYYAIGLYPILIAFGAVFFGNILNTGYKRYLQPILIALPVLISMPLFKYALPNRGPKYIVEHADAYKKLGLLRWEDGKDHALPQDFADMLGWKELAQKVDSIYAELPHADQTLVLCDNYGQAGAINYYTKQKIEALSYHDDYINWFNLDKKYIDVLRIRTYKENDLGIKETSLYFNTFILADSITNPYAREFKTRIYVFSGAKINVSQKLKEAFKLR